MKCRGLIRLCIVGVWLLVFLRGATAHGQQVPYSLDTVFSPSGAFFPAGCWSCIRLDLNNRSDKPMDGYVEMQPSWQAPGPVIHQPVYVPAHSRVAQMSYAWFGHPRSGPGTRFGGAPLIILKSEWRSSGVLIAPHRAELLGIRQIDHEVQTPEDVFEDRRGTLLMNVSGEFSSNKQVNNGDTIRAIAQSQSGCFVDNANASPSDLPRDYIGYDAKRFVLLDGVDPETMDVAQRAALLAHIAAGGVLIVPAPPAETHLQESWLAPYLPVEIVGRRQSVYIDDPVIPGALPMGTPLRVGEKADREFEEDIRRPVSKLFAVETVEAVDAGNGGHVVLRDASFVHAAYRPLGLGRVVFVSFPPGALDPTDPRTPFIWRALLGANQSPANWEQSQLSSHRAELMNALLGRPAPPWKLAAGIAAGYLAILVLIHFIMPTARRPMAFALALAISVLVCVALVGMTQMKRGETPILGGRLAVVDLASDGRGLQQEQLAFLGRNDPKLGLRGSRTTVDAWPFVLDASGHLMATVPPDAPQVDPVPFDAPEAGVRAADINTLWQASAPLSGPKLTIAAQLDSNGVKLTTNNALGGAILSPQLVAGETRFPLSGIATGAATESVNAAEHASSDDFLKDIGGANHEEESRRASILQAALTPPTSSFPFGNAMPGMSSNQSDDVMPMVIGWLSNATAPPLLDPYGGASADKPRIFGDVLLRARAQTIASPIGSKIKVPGALCQLMGENDMPQMIVLRDSSGHPAPHAQGMSFVIGIRPPRWVGELRPTRATATIDFDAPRQTVVLQHGQVSGGQVRENLAGPVISQWPNPISVQTVTFDVTPADLDSAGLLWLRLDVRGEAGGNEIAGRWTARSISFDLDADVTGPPPPPTARKLIAESSAIAPGETPPPAPKQPAPNAPRARRAPKNK